MGNTCCAKRKVRGNIVLLLLGLDNAGKTVAVKNLSGESKQTAVPTVGFSVVNLRHSNYDIKVYDLGGRDDFRDVWESYYVDAHGIIFVVDSSDFDRLTESQNVLFNIMANNKIQGKPVLLLANKQDHENALDEIDLIEKLDLEALANTFECPTLVKCCCANSTVKLDPGIESGYNWILKYIIREYPKLNKRVMNDMRKQEEIDQMERAEKLARIKLLNDQETIITDLEISTNEEEQVPNGANSIPTLKDFFVNENAFAETISDSSDSINSIPQIYYEPVVPEIKIPSRPHSATNLVRQQLQLEGVQRRPSLKLGNNKTKPLNLYGVRTPKSAVTRSASSKAADRRNLRSAGDSVFVISNSNKITLPENNGAGDLGGSFYRQSSTIQMTPINDVHFAKLPNGLQF